MTSSVVAAGLIWYVVFLLSTTLHEASHAWASLRMGDPTAYHGGQVTLNPLPHVRREPFGMVVVPILVFALSGWMVGWASAPYDPQWADRHPKRSGLMALAGPAANLVLVVAAAVATRIGLAAGAFAPLTALEESGWYRIVQPAGASPGAVVEGAALMLSVLFVLNVILLVFNLIPLPPLDGSGAVALVLPDRWVRSYREALRQPAISLAGLLLAWWIFGWLFGPLLGVSLGLLYLGVG